MKTRVGMIGATGYTGVELLRLLLRHPEVEVTVLTSQKYAGRPIDQVFPSSGPAISSEVRRAVHRPVLPKRSTLSLPPYLTRRPWRRFLSSSAGEKGRRSERRFPLSRPVRCTSAGTRSTPARELLSESVYGLPELHREKIRDAKIVGNPGCYPTGALIPLIPLMKQGSDSLPKHHHRFEVRGERRGQGRCCGFPFL